MSSFRLRVPALICGIIILGLDQLTKYLVLSVQGVTPGILAAPLPFFNLVLVWNRGISFGLLNQYPQWMSGILLALTGMMTLALIGWMCRSHRRLTLLGLGLVIGGALGNIIDRIRFGAVVDFLDFHAFGQHWPAFNIADSAIFVGVVFLLLDSVLEAKEQKPCKSLSA